MYRIYQSLYFGGIFWLGRELGGYVKYVRYSFRLAYLFFFRIGWECGDAEREKVGLP